MVLMQVQRWKTFEIWIIEWSEKYVNLKCYIIRNSSFTSAKIKSVFIWSDEINNVIRFLIFKSHLTACLFNNAFNQYPNCLLLDNGSFVKLKHSFDNWYCFSFMSGCLFLTPPILFLTPSILLLTSSILLLSSSILLLSSSMHNKL